MHSANIAKVVVDVPSNSIDRPFDYEIPSALIGIVRVGSRVIVPFSGRRLQGYVVAIHDTPEVKKLKQIEAVLESEPPLTEELIKLGEWMSTYYVCPRSTALHVMVPSVMRSKYVRAVQRGDKSPMGQSLLPSEETINLWKWLQNTDYILWDEAADTFSEKLLYTGMKEGWIRSFQLITDSITTKKIQVVSPAVNVDELQSALEERSKQAKGQRKVLSFFIDDPYPSPVRHVMEETGVGRAVIKALVEEGLLILEDKEIGRDPYAGRFLERTSPLSLTDLQQGVLDEIVAYLDAQEHTSFLLHGVTGSGKTEIYLQSIASCLNKGKEAIVLVPEISLTPQMVERFKGRFGDLVAVLHSRLSNGERYDEWRKIRDGQVKVVIGARSAILAPLRNLGLIIIDEEHESSYKQEESPKYHARDVAIFRAKYNNAVVVLGTATPSVESYALAKANRFRYLTLPERVMGRDMPKVEVVDMRQELKDGNRSMFSRNLYEKIQDRLNKKEQIVLFLNRRGYSTFVMCRTCGQVMDCPHCAISLTYHHSNHKLQCHYCGHHEPSPTHCPTCEGTQIRFFGTGTQKVESEIVKLFPEARIIRMDVDTTTQKGSHERLLSSFGRKEADILLGTQMIAKGLDFPHVTLVGVIAADTILNLPDFRAGERTFQLLTQVSGRAGRHHLAGEVVIQTYTPEHFSITTAATQETEQFYSQELKQRAIAAYPPYSRMICVTFSHDQVAQLVKAASIWATAIKKTLSESSQLFGPVPSPIARIKDRYRYQCLIKYRDEPGISNNIKQVTLESAKHPSWKNVNISIDVDPQIML